MRNLNAYAAPVLVGASLAATAACGGAELQPPAPEQQHALEVIQDYWDTQLHLGKTGVKLVTVRDNQRFECESKNGQRLEDSTAYELAAYCPKSTTITIGEVAYENTKDELQKAGGNPAALPYLLIAHEYGHFLKDKKGFPSTKVDDPLFFKQANELQADCLAGPPLVAVPEVDAKSAASMYSEDVLDDDTNGSHGSIVDRYQSFVAGSKWPEFCELDKPHGLYDAPSHNSLDLLLKHGVHNPNDLHFKG